MPETQSMAAMRRRIASLEEKVDGQDTLIRAHEVILRQCVAEIDKLIQPKEEAKPLQYHNGYSTGTGA